MVLLPEKQWSREQDTAGYITLGCGTDNRGITFLLDGLLTTKFPLGEILMEFAHQMRRRNAVLRASWLPRLQHEEADALTNMDFRHFCPERRIAVALPDLKFGVLDEFMKTGLAYHDEVTALRDKQRLLRESAPSGAVDTQRPARAGWPASRKRKRAGDTLRDREPW